MQTCTDITRAGAWLTAAQRLLAADARIYNLIVEIEQPDLATRESREVEGRVDSFLRDHGRQPIHTVAETLFPATEYRAGGMSRVYEYATTVFQAIKSLPANRKGTYAYRLVRRKISDGQYVNPLETLIEKMRRQLKLAGPQRAIYELDLCCEPAELKFYDPEIDRANPRSGQCLSHLSFKLGPDRELYLTALYRYQYFVQKALGNFKGLARLQACVAREVGIPVGPLVCHATLAVLEDDRLGEPWNRSSAKTLIAQCQSSSSYRSERTIT
jgi:hypothetical protein